MAAVARRPRDWRGFSLPNLGRDFFARPERLRGGVSGMQGGKEAGMQEKSIN
jgi:hypothetical protein